MKKTILVLVGLSLWGIIYFFLQKTQDKMVSGQNNQMEAEFTEIMKFNLQNLNHSTWKTWQQMGVTDSTEIIVKAMFLCSNKENAFKLSQILEKNNLEVVRQEENVSGAKRIKIVATYPKHKWTLLKMNNVGQSLLLSAKSVDSEFLYFDVDKTTVPNPQAIIF